ncbi:MAG: capsule biosynthesis protein [Lautropia sp.]
MLDPDRRCAVHDDPPSVGKPAGDDKVSEAPLGMIARGLAAFRGRRVLMLQGPIGPFFTRLARDLRAAGAIVFKVDFNGGDRLFSRSRDFDARISYRGRGSDWPAAFEGILDRTRADTILLFGDCRPIHVPAIEIAKRRKIEVGVFEEGYLRPDHITIERDGVNDHSPLPKEPGFYGRSLDAAQPASRPVGSAFLHTALWGALYYAAASAARPFYPHYWHHRPLGVGEARFWILSLWRKLRYRVAEREIERLFVGETPSPFYLVPLQTCGDAQVRVHSPFGTVPRFIEHVMRSFAAHAPADALLAIKHHPLDRGFTDHRKLILALSHELGLLGRCHYIHDQHLPTLLRRTLGVVTINSTVGLSAIGEGVPVATCGHAIYDIDGLVYQGSLDDFWRDAPASCPDLELWHAFKAFMLAHTQFNGNFYRRLPGTGNASGVVWPGPNAEAPVAAPMDLSGTGLAR